MIEKCHVPLFFEILCKFLSVDYRTLLNYFQKKSKEEEFIKIKKTLEYMKPTCFVSDSMIKFDETLRKKPPYLKYKTLPKWHFHALDMIR